MPKPSKVEKAIFFTLIKLVALIRPRWATKLQIFFYRRWGMQFNGTPNYISSKIWFDGTDYGLIRIGNQVTMSSYIRVLTHDWALHTVAKAFGVDQARPLGRVQGVEVGDYSFVGTGSILMPGSRIGRGCIIGAGTVVRGEVPDFSIYVGSPGAVIGNSREYLERALGYKIDSSKR